LKQKNLIKIIRSLRIIMNDILIWEIYDNIGHIILNDPPTNKMTKDFFIKFNNLIQNIIPKLDINALILYGSGRHFSSGADLNLLFNNILNEVELDNQGNIVKYPEFLADNNTSFINLNKMNIPIIAAINGVCLGSALELALFAHIRICTKNTLFGFPESSFNIMPGLGGTQKVLTFLKYSQALELILKGSNFDAKQAYEWNIVDKVVEKKELLSCSEVLAKKLAGIKDYNRNFVNDYLKDFFYN